jgi:O-antigen/teichoic acid export membrane protein
LFKKTALLKSISVYGLGGVLSQFAGVLTVPVYTRFLSTADFGLLDLILSFAGILTVLVTMEMHSGYARSYYESKSINKLETLRGTVISSILINYLVISIIVFIAILIFDREFLYIVYAIPVMFNLLPATMVMLTLATLRMEEKPIIFSIITLSNILMIVAFGIAFVTIFNLGIRGILWSNAIVSIVIYIILNLFLQDYTRFTFNLTYFRETFKYSAPIVPAVLSSWINIHIGRIFIAGALSLNVLGIYAIAIKVSLILSIFTRAFRYSWDPIAIQSFGVDNSERLFSKTLNYYILTATLIAIITTIFSPLIVSLLAPIEYYNAVAYVGILVIGQMWDGSIPIISSGNSWARKTYFNSIGTIIPSILLIVILYFFTKSGGVILVAALFLGTSIMKTIIILFFAQRNHFIPYEISSLILSLVFTIIFSTISYLIFSHTVWEWWLQSLSLGLVGLIILMSLVFKFYGHVNIKNIYASL